MSRGQVIVSLIAIPLLVLLVACGGDKKDSSSSNDGGGSSSNSSNSGGSSGGSVSSNDGALSLDNCRQYASFAATAAGASAQAFNPNQKVDKKAFEDMVKASPSEIRSDMQVIADALISWVTELEKVGVNLNDPSSFARLDPAKLQQLENASKKLEDPKVEAAFDKVDKFFTSKCS
jgi:hypothetical protein